MSIRGARGPPALPPQPDNPALQPSDTSPSRPSKWAALLARIYEVFPLICPSCQTPRGPPQTELAMDPAGGDAQEVAQDSFPDDLDQSPTFDPTEPESVPDDHFDQSQGG